jgi:putative ABC transport system permease protein
MLLWTILRIALRNLLANRLRTFLAMLGIIIGTASVIAMLAVGTGAQRSILGSISAIGTNLLIVRPGQVRQRGVSTGTTGQRLKISDAEAILQSVKGIHSLTPVVQGGAQSKYLNKNSRTTLIGCAPTYFKIRNYEIEKGRSFTDIEVDGNQRLAVLGPDAAENLFGKENPLGKFVKLNGRTFRVVGITKAKGDSGMFSPDDIIFIPYKTAMVSMFGQDYLREIDIQMHDGEKADEVIPRIEKLLRMRHRIPEKGENDFTVSSQEEILSTVSTVTGTIKLMLSAIASISLLVGGIGIMNIMLVTVTERTREIGIRMAIGAQRRDIMVQFVMEATALGGIGGGVGILIGVGLSLIINSLLGYSLVVDPATILMSAGFSLAIGVFFGIYPAYRAASLDPIECLRYE